MQDPAGGGAIILAAALEHFLADGYVGTSVDAIAETAGVSKRTVYNIYQGKEALFRAVLREAIDTAEAFAQASEDLADDLRDLAERQATAILGGGIVRLRRLLIGEAERFPELASEYYARAPGRVMGVLADLFATFADRGLLEVDDPQVAAEHFSFLVMGEWLCTVQDGGVQQPVATMSHGRRWSFSRTRFITW